LQSVAQWESIISHRTLALTELRPCRPPEDYRDSCEEPTKFCDLLPQAATRQFNLVNQAGFFGRNILRMSSPREVS
jgi:hypothetical protein